jgi:sRNA-binding protein
MQMIQVFSGWLVSDIHNKGDGTTIVTKEQIQHAHSNLTMKLARLVKVRKEEMNKKRNRPLDTLQEQQIGNPKCTTCEKAIYKWLCCEESLKLKTQTQIENEILEC